MKEQTEGASLRKRFLHWIGYLMRDHESNEVDFMQMLNKEYQQWAQKILVTPRGIHPTYGERPCDYMRRAVRAASLAQLQELNAIRYILDHPVPNGVAYSGNCSRVPAAPPRLAAPPRKKISAGTTL